MEFSLVMFRLFYLIVYTQNWTILYYIKWTIHLPSSNAISKSSKHLYLKQSKFYNGAHYFYTKICLCTYWARITELQPSQRPKAWKRHTHRSIIQTIANGPASYKILQSPHTAQKTREISTAWKYWYPTKRRDSFEMGNSLPHNKMTTNTRATELA